MPDPSIICATCSHSSLGPCSECGGLAGYPALGKSPCPFCYSRIAASLLWTSDNQVLVSASWSDAPPDLSAASAASVSA